VGGEVVVHVEVGTLGVEDLRGRCVSCLKVSRLGRRLVLRCLLRAL
jgi:hypothetical protein